VIALLDRPLTVEGDAEAFDAMRDAYAAADLARSLGHQPRVASREHEESVAYCAICSAMGNADGVGEHLVVAGSLYTDPCGV